MHKISYLLVILIWQTNLANCQTRVTDTLQLPEASVEDSKIYKDQTIGVSRLHPFDWAIQPLSEISYKTYGPSGVGSLSYRNLPSSQTQLVWNGLNLSSPLLGQADANQILLSPEWQGALRTTNQVPTAGSAPPSSIAVEALKLVADTAVRGAQARVRTSAGTYGLIQNEGAVEVKQNAWSAYGRFFHQQARNDFRIYRTDKDDPTLPQFQVNASSYNRQVEGRLSFQPKSYTPYAAKLSYLYNQSYRNLPPPLTKYRSLENLTSELHAVSLQQTVLCTSTLNYTSTIGLVHEASSYTFENGRDVSPYGTQSAQLAGTLKKIFAHPHNSTISVNSFQLSHSNVWAHPMRGDYPSVNLTVHSLRADVDARIASLVARPSLSAFIYNHSTHVRPGLYLLKAITRPSYTYRIEAGTQYLFQPPTLNDLYYPIGGNALLKPEEGRVYEATLALAHSRSWCKWELAVTPFIYKYQSFIAWLPEGNIWTPHQRENACVSGGTVLFTSRLRWQQSQLVLRQQITLSQGGYGGNVYTLSSRPEAFIYAPSLRSTSSLRWEYKLFAAEVQASFTGARSVDPFVSQPMLPGYTLYTLRLEIIDMVLPIGKLAVSGQCTWASRPDYAFIANYAAPRTTGSLSLNYQFGYEK